MTGLAAPVRSAAGSLASPAVVFLTLSVAAVLGAQLLATKLDLLGLLMVITCIASTLIAAAQRRLALTRLALQQATSACRPSRFSSFRSAKGGFVALQRLSALVPASAAQRARARRAAS